MKRRQQGRGVVQEKRQTVRLGDGELRRVVVSAFGRRPRGRASRASPRCANSDIGRVARLSRAGLSAPRTCAASIALSLSMRGSMECAPERRAMSPPNAAGGSMFRRRPWLARVGSKREQRPLLDGGSRNCALPGRENDILAVEDAQFGLSGPGSRLRETCGDRGRSRAGASWQDQASSAQKNRVAAKQAPTSMRLCTGGNWTAKNAEDQCEQRGGADDGEHA